MKYKYKDGLFLGMVLLWLQGCSLGYSRVLFMTKSNFGLDIETKPPTAEISIARREGVIEPSFDGDTLPVAAAFRGESNPLGHFIFGVSSIFAGGDAAVIVTDLANTSPKPTEVSRLCLQQKPVGSFLWWKSPSLAPQENETRPLFFGTDTLFGLKVAWDGLTSEIPDTLKIGFHRKEVALAPINGRIGCSDKKDGYEVWMASFISWIDVNVRSGGLRETSTGYAQGFATGAAARNWAALPRLKSLVLRYANPELADAVNFNTQPEAAALRQRISGWFTQASGNRPALRKWLLDKAFAGPETGAEVSWLYAAPVEQLQAAIAELKVS